MPVRANKDIVTVNVCSIFHSHYEFRENSAVSGKAKRLAEAVGSFCFQAHYRYMLSVYMMKWKWLNIDYLAYMPVRHAKLLVI